MTHLEEELELLVNKMKHGSRSEENIPGYDKLREEYDRRKNLLTRLEEELELLVNKMKHGNLTANTYRNVSNMAEKYKPKVTQLNEELNLDKLQVVVDLLEQLPPIEKREQK